MNQLSMFDEVPEKLLWLKGEIAFSLSYDQDKILKDIIRLHNNGQAFDVDCTYSKGVMWRQLPEPMFKFDINPQAQDVTKASADQLPLPDNTIQSIMFDPPFKSSKSNVKGIVEQRFTAFESVDDLYLFYWYSLREFWRVLLPGGIVVIKCQDGVSGGHNHFAHYAVEWLARDVGFTEIDLFVLGSKSMLMSPNMRNQQHARKNHSFFLVFQKRAIRDELLQFFRNINSLKEELYGNWTEEEKEEGQK